MKTTITDLDTNQTKTIEGNNFNSKSNNNDSTDEFIKLEKELQNIYNPDENDLTLIDTIYHNVKDIFRGLNLNMDNFILYVIRTIECVELLSNSGDNKKEYVLRIITDVINESTNLNNEENEFMKFMLDGLIESIFKISNKEINLKVKKQKNQIEMTISQIIDSLVDKCLNIIKNKNYTPEELIINIPLIIGMIMSLTETYKNLSGSEKKNVIINVFINLFNDKLQSLEHFQKLSDKYIKQFKFILKILPILIDLFIEISKKKYKINKIRKKFRCC